MRLGPKFCILTLLLSFCRLGSSLAHADENPEKLVVRKFDVTLVRKSRSQRIYLFRQDLEKDPELSSPGKLILIKRNQIPILAFRVLRSYGGNNQFAAKILKNYHNGTPLIDDQFVAVEKIGSVSEISLTPMDEKDLKELETPPEFLPPPEPEPSSIPMTTDPLSEDSDPKAKTEEPSEPEVFEGKFDVIPYDPELDSGSSPPPQSLSGETEDTEETLDPYDERALIAEEIVSLDPDPNWLSFNFGILKNYGLLRDLTTNQAERSGSINVAGFGIRYGYTLAEMPFIRSQSVQDSIVPELGVYYYTITNYTDSNDNYTVVPLFATLRYTILAGETYGFFIYGGVVDHLVLSSENDKNGFGEQNLKGVHPAAGGGLLFHVGPNWNLRVDLGIENIGAGLILRF